MRRRDRIQKRVVSLFAPGATPNIGPEKSTTVARQTSVLIPNQPARDVDSAVTNPTVAAQKTNPIFEKAILLHLQTIPADQKAVFEQASLDTDQKDILSKVRDYDATHKEASAFRSHSQRLSKVLDLLNRFMGGLAIGIQANPEASAIVVGALRIVIDLALKFTTFFSRLLDMLCKFEDYLEPLAEYAHAADISLIEKNVVRVYANILDFSWKARRIFVDHNGTQRRWTSFRAFMRQHWETFESEFGTIKEDMQYHLNLLLHSVQAIHFDAYRTAEDIRLRNEKRKQRSEFLAWISDVDFEKVHQDMYRKRQEHTCAWLIQEPKYQEWFSSPHSALLWCHGKPGIGKSILASHVIEELTSRVGLQTKTAICFVYYNYRNPDLGDITHILAALIKQLCRGKDTVPDDLLRIKDDALPASLAGTPEDLMALIEDFDQVYIVFDALDECLEEERAAILNFITSIVTASVPCHVKVFVTSRREMDIAEAFEKKNIPTIQVKADSVAGDIENFARSQVEDLRSGRHGKTLYIDSDDLAKKVVDTLASRADGMFLWVNLQLNSLCQVSKARKDHLVEGALHSLPQDLSETYDRILARIEAQSPYMRELALNCLTWVFHARWPIRTSELQEALAVDARGVDSQEKTTSSVEVILEACANLLEEVNGAIRPIHHTVQEYFKAESQGNTGRSSTHALKNQLLHLSSIHARLALACLKYLCSLDFDQPVSSEEELQSRSLENLFMVYTIHNFDWHMSKCDQISSQILEQLEIFLNLDSGRLAAILQLKLQRHEEFNDMSFTVSAATFVFGTCLYNFPAVRQRWLENKTPAFALHLAASAGLTDAVRELLAIGYDVNEKDQGGATSLYHACYEGYFEISRMLIDAGAEVNSLGGLYGSPLQAASYSGEKAVVNLLLAKGANVNTMGGAYGTALEAATFQGYNSIMKILIDAGANKAAADVYGDTSLHEASAQGNALAVELLLSEGAEINVNNRNGRTPLHVAAEYGTVNVVKILLDKGANIGAQDHHGDTPLHLASRRDHQDTVSQLLEHGADSSLRGFGGCTPLHIASSHGHIKLVRIFLEHGACVISPDDFRIAPFMVAVSKDHIEAAKLLLRESLAKSATSNNCNRWFDTIPNFLAFRGHLELLRFVYEQCNATHDITGFHRRSPLHCAAVGRHVDTFEYLIGLGFDPAAVDAKGDDVLCYASAGGSAEIVSMLLQKTPASTTTWWTPLHWACKGGSVEVVKLLIKYGCSSQPVSISTQQHWSALDIALLHGNESMLECLSLSEKSHLGVEIQKRQPHGANHQLGHICDGCELEIYGLRYHCCTCPDFDYCFMCKPLLEILHLDHGWKCFEPDKDNGCESLERKEA